MNTDLKPFLTYLVQNDIVDLSNIFQEQGGTWKLVKDFGGLTAGTAFGTRDEMLNRIYTAVINEYQQRASHLKAAV